MMTSPMKDQCPVTFVLEELGDLIRIRRSMLGLNRANASSRVGVSMYVMSRLENGKAVRTDSLVKVFQGLGLAVAATPINRTGFTLPPLDKSQQEASGGSALGIEPSGNLS